MPKHILKMNLQLENIVKAIKKNGYCGYRVSRGKGVWKHCPICGKKIK